MSLSPIIEVAIALVLVYYILGLIVSFISARVLEMLQTRGQGLEDNLKELVGPAKLGDLLDKPQIKALAPVRYAGSLGLFNIQVTKKKAEQIPGADFIKVTKTKIEQIPVANLVDAVFDTFLLVDKQTPYTANELIQILGALPDSQAKTTLLNLVNEGVTDINQLRAKTSMWFSAFLKQVANIYKANARKWVIILSLGITLLLGVDSIQFTSSLWHNAELRASANALATYYTQQGSDSTQVSKLVDDLSNFGFKIGWWSAPANMPTSGTAMDWFWWVFWKIVGLGITAAAVSQGSSFWFDILRQLKGESTTPPEPSTP